ncbi:FG-GAP-like repeat-containing protein [Streptomyces formicae]|uniref:FG-GAP-like repeat-containing protein n=1 Tax=Streptomyces formicae TaxID=1616117 RepID=UPI001F3FF3DE|nr:FG-GAP-like repeat-containing protein [Streptomyces formicae]
MTAVSPAVADARPAGSEGTSAGPAEETAASRQAARSGDRVEVVSGRTEYATVYANPDGTFTQDTATVPVRTKRDGKLVDVDETLEEQADGTLAPRAASVGVRFSGGGKKTPLATVTRDGRSMSVGWPGELPAPKVEGDTATYPDVLPGVDVKLRASVNGFQQVLVVKDAEAAHDPALKSLRFALASDGVDVRADGEGNLTARNPAGKVVFTAPTPTMWDSAGRPTGDGAKVLARSVGGTSPRADENPFEPREGAGESRMPIRVDGDEMVLTPDRDLLTHPETVYPVYIDPSVSSPRLGWTSVSKKHPGTSYWNHSSHVARVGHESETGGTWRSFVQFNPRSLHGKQITRSTMRIKNTHSWSCTKKPVELWLTAAISSATTWNKQPAWYEKYATVNGAKGWSSSCPAGNLEFDTTKVTAKAAAGKWNKLALGLRADESNVNAWKKFDARTAVLSTTYNSTPNLPTAVDTVPSTIVGGRCGDNGTHVTLGNTDVQLTAKVSDPDGGTVTARFHLWPTGKHDANPGLIVNRDVKVSNKGVARTTVSKSLLKKHIGAAKGSYSWKVQARDGKAASDWRPTLGAPGCRFAFDPDRPSNPPSATSAQFPDGANGKPEKTGDARTQGSFTFSAGGVGDVVKYEYWSDWDPTVRSASPAKAGGSATVKLTPPSAGPHRLIVRSLDKANNRSDTAVYSFYADSPGQPDEPGDLNGDGNPDLLALRANGELALYPGIGDGRPATPSPASKHSFDGSLITHRGDWSGDGYEDVIATTGAKGSRQLHMYPNNGFGYACTGQGESAQDAACEDQRLDLTVADEADDHFRNADQILAVGDVDGPTDLDGDGEIGEADLPSFPDLLVKEGKHLWLYYGHPYGYLDEYAEPVLIGDGDWTDYDLAAPGDVTGNGHVDLLVRKRSSGELFLSQGTGPGGEGFGDASARTRVASGFGPAAVPLLASGGDADNDGRPDLWATAPGTSAGLRFHPRLTPTGLGAPVTVGASGWSGLRSLS